MSRAPWLGLTLAAMSLAVNLAIELRAGAPGAAAAADHRAALSLNGDAALPKLRPAAAASPEDITAWLQQSLARPLFSLDRRPPMLAVKAAAPAVIAPLPRLTGVTIGTFGRHAIFAGPPGGKPVVVAEGGAIGSYTVLAISPGRISVTGPDGTGREVALPFEEAGPRLHMGITVPQAQLSLAESRYAGRVPDVPPGTAASNPERRVAPPRGQ